MTFNNMKFEPYFQNRLIHKSENGHYVIIPEDVQEPVPISCPVCNFLFRKVEDETAWYKYNCCDRCSMFWAIPRKDDWVAGWRPSKEELEKEILNRPMIAIDIKIE